MKLMFIFLWLHIILFLILPNSIPVCLCSVCQRHILKQKWNFRCTEWVIILPLWEKRGEIRLSMKLLWGQKCEYKGRALQRVTPASHSPPQKQLKESLLHDLFCPTTVGCHVTVYFRDKIIAKSEYPSWPLKSGNGRCSIFQQSLERNLLAVSTYVMIRMQKRSSHFIFMAESPRTSVHSLCSDQ